MCAPHASQVLTEARGDGSDPGSGVQSGCELPGLNDGNRA